MLSLTEAKRIINNFAKQKKREKERARERVAFRFVKEIMLKNGKQGGG